MQPSTLQEPTEGTYGFVNETKPWHLSFFIEEPNARHQVKRQLQGGVERRMWPCSESARRRFPRGRLGCTLMVPVKDRKWVMVYLTESIEAIKNWDKENTLVLTNLLAQKEGDWRVCHQVSYLFKKPHLQHLSPDLLRNQLLVDSEG